MIGETFVHLFFFIIISVLCLIGASVEGRTDVAHKRGHGSKFGLTSLNCSLDSSTTDISTLASLTILGSRQYRGKEEYDVLAKVDLWDNVPMLGSELVEADVMLTGRIEEDRIRDSALILSWNTPAALCQHTYKCVAHGFSRKWQATSVVSELKLGHIAKGKCRSKMDTLVSKLQRLTEVSEITAKTSEGISVHIQGQNARLQELESSLEEVYLNTRLLSTLYFIDRTRYDISPVYDDRVYLVSRDVQDFNIGRDDAACVSQGGYLMEIDDDRESQFVLRFTQKLGGTNFFMTGANDIEREGLFVFYHSKKPMRWVTWLRHQPDNAGGQEDCVHFAPEWNGLNDVPCDTRGKYVCEVPLTA